MVLGAAHKLLHGVMKQKVQLHPPEISLVRSGSWARRLMAEAGLQPVSYSFGPRDGFVQAVLVGDKR